jgi:DNA topoisomerase-3
VIVCIAEKPSVAREIASVLGARSRRDGYMEGNGYQVTWTFGHLCTLKSPDEYDPKWKRWALDLLPIIPRTHETKLIRQKGISKQFSVIKSLIKNCDSVVNCGDAGIEGELIQRWVLQKAGCKKKVLRLWISSLTEEAIKEGFSSLKSADDFDRLYEAGRSRAIGDWLLGMNASRLYTLKFARGAGVLSIGRVQTPTLALIVARHNEIENFVPEPYYILKTEYRSSVFYSEKKKITDYREAEELCDKVTGKPFTITDVSEKKVTEPPPLLFDLTSLQVECNKKFGLSADGTLKCAQSLYEKKVISYPRVDTRYLPDDIYPKIPSIMKNLTEYSQFTALLNLSGLPQTKRVFNNVKVTDHHAIIPTNKSGVALAGTEKSVYDLICRTFIAAFFPPAQLLKTVVKGESIGVKFAAKGSRVESAGWRVLFEKELSKSSKDKSDQQLPEFSVGESGPHKPQVESKMTKPPAAYTEASLLRAMESAGKQVDDEELRELMKQNGLGRPSTRANIIETLFRRKYVRREKKNIVPTQTGIQLIDRINNPLLTSAGLTGIWEGKLRKIEDGEYTSSEFITEMEQMIVGLIDTVRSQSGTIHVEQKVSRRGKTRTEAKRSTSMKKSSTSVKSGVSTTVQGLPCPRCKNGKIIRGKRAYGCDQYNNGCTLVIPFEIGGKQLTESEVAALLTKGRSTIVRGITGSLGNISLRLRLRNGVLEYEDSKNADTYAQLKKGDPLSCPLCGEGRIVKGNAAYGCSRYKEGCTFIIPFADGKKR